MLENKKQKASDKTNVHFVKNLDLNLFLLSKKGFWAAGLTAYLYKIHKLSAAVKK